MSRKIGLIPLCCIILSAVCAAEDVTFDLTRPEQAGQWKATHHISRIDASAEGAVIHIAGNDPYLTGPARDFPDGQPLWLEIKLRSDESGGLQVFYFQRVAEELHSVRRHVRAGQWETIRIAMPALGKGYRLRIDPPGGLGRCTLASVSLVARRVTTPPQWPAPQAPALAADAPRIAAGKLTVVHAADRIGAFRVEIDGKPFSAGFDRPLIGYITGQQQRWLDLAQRGKTTAKAEQGELVVSTTCTDEDGGLWTITQRFAPAKVADAIDVRTSVMVDQDRHVAFLPLFLLTPGVGSFGQGKSQALLPGLEYLDKDEPSSSEADIIGPGARRQVPDSLKLTFPLACIQSDGAYLAMAWEPKPYVATVFDSPDRLFKSGGHVMGLIFPGSNGGDREEGNLLPHGAELLQKDRAITVSATLLGGKGRSVVPAVQQYVALRGLPRLPETGLDQPSLAKLFAAGWLDSKTKEGSEFRHAWPGSFKPQPAADVPYYLKHLAEQVNHPALAQRLRETSAGVLKLVPPANLNFASVSHVRYPVAALHFGSVPENVRRARESARKQLGRFEADGSLLYKAGEVDYGKTHFARDANGLTAAVVHQILTAASLSGDRELLERGLRLLRAMDKFRNSVPRGAQTWECPLHTPDILASAHLVHAYLLGYELSGDAALLETARYWAWTGVPFVYLRNPTDNPVGPYATIAVYGATSWRAPNWMGLPVQWCGLVYADALYQLAPRDPAGPWKQLADGIVLSGIQQTFGVGGDRQGMLPDSFDLRAQHRNDPAINPGTVQANAFRALGQAPYYSFASARKYGALLHAPGSLADVVETEKALSFAVKPAITGPYRLLVARLPDGRTDAKKRSTVELNGVTAPDLAIQYDAAEGWLILTLDGPTNVRLRL